jgi:hypothetical protein
VTKPTFYDRYKPQKLDARVNKAAAMLSMRPHMRNIDANGLRAVFNLKLGTAQRLLDDENARRGLG